MEKKKWSIFFINKKGGAMKTQSDKEFLKRLGKRIRKIRKASGLSMEALAYKCGIHPTYVGEIERATVNPSVLSVVKIADALNVPIREVIKVEEKRDEDIVNEILGHLGKINKKELRFISAVAEKLTEWEK